MMEQYIKSLPDLVMSEHPNFGNDDDLLSLLYEAYTAVNTMDDDHIKEDFNELYQAMNGMELKAMDRIIYPVCTLCRDHERAGFVAGIKVGIRLAMEGGINP